jgi:uncharacterized protein YhjY with autotransporter beta-barrel domain
LKSLGGKGAGLGDKRRSGYTGAQTRDHGVMEAERIVKLSQKELRIEDWNELKKGDWRMGNEWLAQHLSMGARTTVSRIMGQARQRLQSDRKAKSLGRRLEKMIDQL